MVAQTPPTRFTLDPTRVEEFLQDISSFDMCFRDVASKWGTTVGGLALFITSEDGLQTIATAELAAALRIRLTALNLLPSVVEALGYIVMEYSREERRIPLENSLQRIRLLELKRRNAHRAGTLIFKLAHFNPKPIKSYTVRPVNPSTPPGGTAVALDSRGLEHERHACAEPQACHTHETLQVVDTIGVPSAQTCGMPKRPLGHGEASDLATPPAPAVAASTKADVVAEERAQTCGMPKRPLGHGDATDLDASPPTINPAMNGVGSLTTHVASLLPSNIAAAPTFASGP